MSLPTLNDPVLQDGDGWDVFEVEPSHAHSKAVWDISADLSRTSWIVDTSDEIFLILAGLWGAFILVFTSILVPSEPSSLVISLLLLVFLLGAVRLRVRRRGYLPALEAHYQRERLNLSESSVKHEIPLHYPHPYPYHYRLRDIQIILGRHTTRLWTFAEISRLSIHRAKSGRVTAIELKVGEAFFSFGHFHNKNHLADLLKAGVSPIGQIEELPRVVPIWARILLIAVGYSMLLLLIWGLLYGAGLG